MSFFYGLTRHQREAVGLLQIGTFLEYFDLMLYVHMAVLLNTLFFPQTDPHNAQLLTAFAFCSTFVLRPFGAILFGYIGDNIGRKTTVIITTMLMSGSCIVMANMPTYAEIGLTAAWAVTACRVVQGLSSMGEIVGAEIYMTEIVKPPAQYPVVSFMACSSAFGTMAALAVVMIIFTLQLNWRQAFWFGATIALVGTIARIRLRETPEFVDMKRRLKMAIEAKSTFPGAVRHLHEQSATLGREKVNILATVAFFLIYSAWPVCFYFAYIHCGTIMKNTLHYTSEQVIMQNFWVSIVQCVGYVFFALLSYRVYPLTILKYRAYALAPLLVLCPFILNTITSGYQLFFVQSIFMFLAMTAMPAMPIFIKTFPVFRRFTYTSFMYAFTRALMYVVTSFGLVYLTEFLGSYGLWVIFIPMLVSFLWGIHYYESHGIDQYRSPSERLNAQ